MVHWLHRSQYVGCPAPRVRIEQPQPCIPGLTGDPQDLLASLVGKTRVSLFEVARPSLQDIFVRIAGSEAERAAEDSQVASTQA